MKKMFLFLILSIALPLGTFAQKDSLKILELEIKLDSIAKLVHDTEKLYQHSSGTLDVADSIVDTTALVLGLISIIFLVLGFLGYREIRALQKSGKEMLDLAEKMKTELSEVQKVKEEIHKGSHEIHEKIKLESSVFLKTIYLLNEGVSDFHSGRLYEAERKFTKILEINKEDYEATCYLARALFGQNQFDRALETITKAIGMRANPHRAYFIMGENYRRKRKYKESIEALVESIGIKKREATYTSMGYTYLAMGKFPQAKEAFAGANKLRRYSTPVCGLAKSFLKMDKQQQAKKYFEETKLLAEEEISAGTKYVWSYYNKALAHCFGDEEEECLQNLDLALKRNLNPQVIKEQLEGFQLMQEDGFPPALFEACIQSLERKLEELP